MVLFETDPDFCPQCGSIVIIPKRGDCAKCDICSYIIDYKKFENIYSSSCITYNEEMVYKSYSNVENPSLDMPRVNLGPVIDRKCSKCSYEKMTYSTMQTRSADEGQTVFYTCIKCSNKEIEYA